MMIEQERTQEDGKGELLHEGVHNATLLDDALFSQYLAFLDALIEHQVEPRQCQGYRA